MRSVGKKRSSDVPGWFRKLVASPKAMADFRQEYGIPEDVTLKLAELRAQREGSKLPRLAPYDLESEHEERNEDDQGESSLRNADLWRPVPCFS